VAEGIPDPTKVVVTGNSSVTIQLGASSVLVAGASDAVSVSGGGNTVTVGSGTDVITLTGTEDTVDFGTSSGNATIINAIFNNSGIQSTTAANELDFGAGITDENLWFVHTGNNLQIDLLGTTHTVTISGFYSGAGNQLAEISAGGVLLDSGLNQLVQAMATYSSNNPGFNPMAATNTQAPNNTALQAAIAAAWHH
jgi:hypothetical protein